MCRLITGAFNKHRLGSSNAPAQVPESGVKWTMKWLYLMPHAKSFASSRTLHGVLLVAIGRIVLSGVHEFNHGLIHWKPEGLILAAMSHEEQGVEIEFMWRYLPSLKVPLEKEQIVLLHL